LHGEEFLLVLELELGVLHILEQAFGRAVGPFLVERKLLLVAALARADLRDAHLDSLDRLLVVRERAPAGAVDFLGVGVGREKRTIAPSGLARRGLLRPLLLCLGFACAARLLVAFRI